MLKDPEQRVRTAAVTAFGRVQGEGRERWGAELVRMLEGKDEGFVRQAALAALGKLEPTSLAQHVAVVRTLLTAADAGVCAVPWRRCGAAGCAAA